MADKKISELTSATTPLAGTEVLPIVQSSTTKKVSVENVQLSPISSGTANAVQFLNSGKTPSTSTKLKFDGESLGVGLTPNAWAGVNAIQVGPNPSGLSLFGYSGTGSELASNTWFDGSNYKYGASGAAAKLVLSSGQVRLYTAPSGTANANISFSLYTTFGNDLKQESGNVIFGTAAKGVNFTANTPAAGMTSQLLNDYQEGTWTPQYTNSTPPTTPYTMTIKSATYTKIGRQVTLRAYIGTNNVDTTGAAGSLIISGLPFTSAANGWSAVNVGFTTQWNAVYPLMGFVDANSTVIYLRTRNNGNSADYDMDQSHLTTGAAADKNLLMFTTTYFV